MRILLIEDDQSMANSLVLGLKYYGHIVDCLSDGMLVSQILKEENFDVMILDIGLPGRSGYDILRQIRTIDKNFIPVLILTALESIKNKVLGLDLGADDYLIKPFELDELNARLNAIRRSRVFASDKSDFLIQNNNISLDPKTFSVKIDDNSIFLSKKEFALLYKLLTQVGKVVTKEILAQCIYGWDSLDLDSNSLEVHMHNLRKKIKLDLIKTIRGVGYMFVNKQGDH